MLTFSSELPPPRQITAIPLNDSSLHVRWKAPVDHSVSGFVVEWFTAREKTSIIQHWQEMNSSCTALVITGNTRLCAACVKC